MALVRASMADDLSLLSAALTYFTILSLFPALVVVVAMLGVIGLSPETLQHLLDAIGERTGSQWVVNLAYGVLASILDSTSTSVFLGLGAVVALWTASAYVSAFMWASDHIYQPAARRSYWRGIPMRLGLALLLLVLLTAAAVMVTVIGPLGSRVAGALGLEGSELLTWSRLTSPLLLIAALLMLALLYKYAPSRRQPALVHLLAGAGAAVVLWLVASAAFSFYLAHFGSYNRVYGALGAAVAFLVWAWILNLAVLVGVEVNKALEGKDDERDSRAAGGPPGAPAVAGDAAP